MINKNKSLLFHLRLASEEATTNMVSTTAEVALEKGTRGSLPCQVEIDVYAVFWSKGPTILSAEIIVVLEIENNVRSGLGYETGTHNITDDFSLIIHDMKIADSDRYFCRAHGVESGSIFSSSSNVTVYGK